MSLSGLYRAIVVNTDDPEARGRVQMQIPQLMGTGTSGWAMPVTPKDSLPAVGDQVMAAFEGGDLSHPLYHSPGDVKPQLTDADIATLVNTPSSSTRTALDDSYPSSDRLGIILPTNVTLADLQTTANGAATFGTSVRASGTITTADTLSLQCDADLSGLTINYTGSGVAVVVGDATKATFRKTIKLPKVIATAKTTNGWAQVAGTVGIDVVNAYSYTLHISYIKSFETGLRVRGANSNGTQQTSIFLGHLDNCKVNMLFTGDATGWSNQNLIFGGRCSHNSNEGVQVPGVRHVVFASIPNPVNANHFFGTSLESPDVVEYHIEANDTLWNVFYGSRFENTAGTTHRRILVTGNSKENQFVGGAYTADLVQVIVGAAQKFGIDSTACSVKVGGLATRPTVIWENPFSNTAPVLSIMAAGGSNASSDPMTAYTTMLTANKWMGKRATDAFNRIEMDMINARMYFGDGTAAPVGYIGGTASAVVVGGSVAFLPLTTGAQDLGNSGLKWRNLWISGSANIGGNVGFYGTTPVAKPAVTGSRGGNAALASLLTALASQGLITDSTTV